MPQYSPTLVPADHTIGPMLSSAVLSSLDPVLSRIAPGSVSPLMAIAPGPTRVLQSSTRMNWDGFLMERHLSLPGERPSTNIDRHVVSMLCGNSSQFDYRLEDGSLATVNERHGSVTFTPVGPVPYVRLQSSAELTHCAFHESFTRRVVDEMEVRPVAKPVFRAGIRDRSIQRIMVLLMEELDASGPSGRLYVDHLAHALVTRCLLLDNACPAVGGRTSALPTRILNRVKEKIDTNLHTNLNLDSLAKESGYSRAHFLRMFHAATGLTPHQFILDLRMKHAQKRIRQTTDSLIDIAAFCGFSSQSHMTTIFRRYLNVTPGEFRRGL